MPLFTNIERALRTLLRARLVTAELDVVEGASRVGGGAAPEEDFVAGQGARAA